MFLQKKLQKITCFFENEGGGVERTDEIRMSQGQSSQERMVKPQLQQNQELLEAKKSSLVDAQKKEGTLRGTLQSVAMNKVNAVKQTRIYEEITNEEDREKKIQELINEFIRKHQPEYEALRANLEAMNPPLPKAEIEEQLQDHESQAFEQFINAKLKEQNIEKKKEQRKQRYLKALVPTGDQELDKKNQELVAKFEVDYVSIKAKILEDQPDLQNDKEKLRSAIGKAIDTRFVEYCEQNSIQIDESQLSLDSNLSETQIGEGEHEYVYLDTKGSILQAQKEYLLAAQELSTATEYYQAEASKYEKLQYIESDNQVVFDLPIKVIELPPGESATFVGASGSSEILYEATKEADGEYTLKFNGHTLKNLPKKEVELIVDLNAVPVINTIFTASSGLYQTLLREYKFLCTVGGTDALENPPLGFIDFLYSRLNDAYSATLEEGNTSSLLGFSISGLPYKERGKYIRNLLSTNIDARNAVIKRLENQKILVNGKINLSRYPR